MLKISLPNKDVKTARPEELAVDSNYDSLKLIVRQQDPYIGEILVKFNRNPGVGTYPIFTFKTGFDYRCFYYVFLDTSKSSQVFFTNTGQDVATQFGFVVAIAKQAITVVDTDDGFRIDYIVTDNGLFDTTGSYCLLKYFVYVNDGPPI